MTNRIALVLATLITAALFADLFTYHGATTLFLLRKLADLVDWVAFWR